MREIIYIGNFAFPNKNASGKRVLGNCMCFLDLDYKVVCISPGTGGHELIKGITSYTIDIGNSIQRVSGQKLDCVTEIISKELNSGNELTVILYGAIFTQKENFQLIRWCHKKRIKVIYDQVDWFELNWHNPIRAIIRANNHRILNQKVIPNCDGMICISEYLSDYHKSKDSVVIPPLAINTIKHSNEVEIAEAPIKIVYAGTSSDVHRPVSQWKDRLDLTFILLEKAKRKVETRPFIIDIYGLTKEQYLNMFPQNEIAAGEKVLCDLGNSVVFHGEVDNEVVSREIEEANFTILIRDIKRSTMAGFPTKISESISCGTPVICNDTSDIRKYVINGVNGFVFDLNESEAALEKILTLDSDQLHKLKKSCELSPFYYKNFNKRFQEFFDGMK